MDGPKRIFVKIFWHLYDDFSDKFFYKNNADGAMWYHPKRGQTTNEDNLGEEMSYQQAPEKIWLQKRQTRPNQKKKIPKQLNNNLQQILMYQKIYGNFENVF